MSFCLPVDNVYQNIAALSIQGNIICILYTWWVDLGLQPDAYTAFLSLLLLNRTGVENETDTGRKLTN